MKWLWKILFGTLLMLSGPSWATETGDFGAAGAKLNTTPTIEQMLQYAIQDEYLARAEYALIIEHYGEIRPFTNIIRSEGQHITMLKALYQTHQLTIPDDTAKAHEALPESLKEAFATGVQAEIDNIAMYEHFLALPELTKPENKDIKDVFTALMNASKNHLRAFQNGLKRS